MAEQRLEPELERARRRSERRPASRARTSAMRRAAAGGSQEARLRAGVVEIAPTSPSAATALAAIASAAARTAAGLSSQGDSGPIEAERRPPVDEDRRPRRLLGEVLADDELVGAAGGREPRRRGPVDPRDVVARPVRPRADDLVALAAADAPVPAERCADEPAARDERKGPRRRH